MTDRFTWVPFYEQTATKLLDWEGRQAELLEFLQKLEDAGLPVVSLVDQDADGNRFPLSVMDPFTFYASFNRGQRKENRQAICSEVKKFLDVEADVPGDFDGIPVVDNRSSWFFSFSKQREVNAIPTLWNVFKQALAPAPLAQPAFAEAFNAALALRRVKINLTMGLYWIRPKTFLALDHNNRRHLDIKIEGELNASSYIEVLHSLEGMGSFPELSSAAWGREPGATNQRSERAISKPTTPPSRTRRLWLWSPGDQAAHWEDLHESGQMAIGWNEIGDLKRYTSLDAMKQAVAQSYPRDAEPTNDSRACYEFTHEIRPGDLVLAKRGRKTLVGYGVVKSEYRHDAKRVALKNVREVQWLQKGSWDAPFLLPMKTLTGFDVESPEALQLREAVGKSDLDAIVSVPPTERRRFSIEEALKGLFVGPDTLEEMLDIWRAKKNLILQGAPGVGKSFIARRLAYALMGYEDPSRIKVVQFHQAYSYEDFVQGYRPNGNGFGLRDGAFVEFCRRAIADEDETYVFVIDEINRGNLSRIFGEMMLLVEGDKRDKRWGVRLAYSPEETFHVPANLFILGLMNTADRSLAVVDYALRRRFAFKTLTARFGSDEFVRHLADRGVSDKLVDHIRRKLGELNLVIANDRSNLGPGFCIGHSYFCDPPVLDGTEADELNWYRRVVENEVLPLLDEYWFDAPTKVDQWRTKLLPE